MRVLMWLDIISAIILSVFSLLEKDFYFFFLIVISAGISVFLLNTIISLQDECAWLRKKIATINREINRLSGREQGDSCSTASPASKVADASAISSETSVPKVRYGTVFLVDGVRTAEFCAVSPKDMVRCPYCLTKQTAATDKCQSCGTVFSFKEK